MTLLGMPFERAASSFGWANLVTFVHHLPPTSAVYREMYGDASEFASELKQNMILADIFDAVQFFNYNYAKSHGGKGRKPKPYPRPFADDGAQRIGSDPIPISEFNDWYYGGD